MAHTQRVHARNPARSIMTGYAYKSEISEAHIGAEEYINNLNLVWKECNRVLSDGCRLCINIGDQFARSVYYGRYKVIPIRTEIIRFCESLGMDYMGAIIWQKTTTMNTSGGGAIMGSFPYPRNGILKMDYEFILLFKKLGNAPKPTQQQKEESAMTKEEWGQYFSSHWNFNGVKQMGHIAMFPEELPKRLIKMFSFLQGAMFHYQHYTAFNDSFIDTQKCHHRIFDAFKAGDVKTVLEALQEHLERWPV